MGLIARFWLLLLLFPLALEAQASRANEIQDGSKGPLRIAVAANFLQPMQVLAKHFQQLGNAEPSISAGSSGKLFAQIRQGAPYDLFFSADVDKPARLLASGDAVGDAPTVYAVGQLALWSPGSAGGETVRAKLIENHYQRLAIANPRLAPYGAAAKDLLTSLGVFESMRRRWVMGENISQAFHLVASGNADAGLVAYSLLNADQRRQSWLVPENLHSPVQQAAVITRHGSSHPDAGAFLRFVTGAPALRVLEEFGYRVEVDIQAGLQP